MSRNWPAALALLPFLTACDDPKPPARPPVAAPAPASTPGAAPVVAAPVLPAGWKTYSDPALGIAFDHGPERRTGDCPEIGEGVVCVALLGTAEKEALVYFQPVDGPLDKVAKDEAGFEANDKGVLMTTYGRFEPVPVERFVARGGPGLKAIVTCGTEDAETGFHAAGGECLWAVVSDGTRSVVATTQGRIGLDPDTLATLASVRFIPRTGARPGPDG